MFDPAIVRQLARTAQTTEINVAREYCQHLFLSAFYRQKGIQRVLFKGGTALRLVYGSPRFSEDLDFSGLGVKAGDIEEWTITAAAEMEKIGISMDIRESKPTSGGYLAILDCMFSGYRVRIQVEVSLREIKEVRGRGVLIAGDLAPAYTAVVLPERRLIDEKLSAVLTRSKPRDFFDVYFLLRKGIIPPAQRGRLGEVRERLERSRENFRTELQDFLPRSHHAILRSFKENLLRELNRYR